MQKAPEIGARVRFPGNSIVGACTGTVTRIYPRYEQDVEGNPIEGKLAPESSWSVAIKVDEYPSPWPWWDRDQFSATVWLLTPEPA